MKRTLFTVGAALALTFLITGCGPSSSHFKDVKSSVFDDSEKMNTSIELSLGVVPISLAGIVAGFIEEPEVQEAREYIKHISHVDVGVYELQHSLKSRFTALSQQVKGSMLHHGFEPIVTIREKNECVGVYAPTITDNLPRELFVVVTERKQVVLVRVRGNFEKLVRAALVNHPLDIPVLDKILKDEIVL